MHSTFTFQDTQSATQRHAADTELDAQLAFRWDGCTHGKVRRFYPCP